MQLQHQALGVFGIAGDNLGLGNQRHALGVPVRFPIVVRVIGQRAALVREEFLAQPQNFIRLAIGLVGPCVDSIDGEPGLLSSPGAVAQSREFNGVIDDPLFGSSAGYQAGRPVRSPVLERLWVFVQ